MWAGHAGGSPGEGVMRTSCWCPDSSLHAAPAGQLSCLQVLRAPHSLLLSWVSPHLKAPSRPEPSEGRL